MSVIFVCVSFTCFQTPETVLKKQVEKMIELGLADGSLIDELMELTAQSLGNLEIQEHFNIIKEIGRGKYGKVLLVTHRFRGKRCTVGEVRAYVDKNWLKKGHGIGQQQTAEKEKVSASGNNPGYGELQEVTRPEGNGGTLE
ncbi:Serine/threonine-protein kinase SBK1 [Larimichthys crocea]|uniref:Uncharacterized protein n=1 Tax=Larimichthys crocea TaxID=215358 RepID=A0ACD3RAV9_LARCR|nr:Serine/threonine-protein kinase SBK1 [Larimichthys crocea]